MGFGGDESFEAYHARITKEHEARRLREHAEAMAGNEHFRVNGMHRSIEVAGRSYPAAVTYPKQELAWVPMENGNLAQVTHWGGLGHQGQFGIRAHMTNDWETHDKDSFHERMTELSREQMSPKQVEQGRLAIKAMRAEAERNPLGEP